MSLPVTHNPFKYIPEQVKMETTLDFTMGKVARAVAAVLGIVGVCLYCRVAWPFTAIGATLVGVLSMSLFVKQKSQSLHNWTPQYTIRLEEWCASMPTGHIWADKKYSYGETISDKNLNPIEISGKDDIYLPIQAWDIDENPQNEVFGQFDNELPSTLFEDCSNGDILGFNMDGRWTVVKIDDENYSSKFYTLMERAAVGVQYPADRPEGLLSYDGKDLYGPVFTARVGEAEKPLTQDECNNIPVFGRKSNTSSWSSLTESDKFPDYKWSDLRGLHEPEITDYHYFRCYTMTHLWTTNNSHIRVEGTNGIPYLREVDGEEYLAFFIDPESKSGEDDKPDSVS